MRRLDYAVASRVLARPPRARGDGPRLLNLGCGSTSFDDCVNADYPSFMDMIRFRHFRPNWFVDVTRPWKCADDYWDGIFTEHMIEHLTYPEAVHCLKECFRTLKRGHWIRISIPDLDKHINYKAENLDFPSLPESIADLTQEWSHRSVWDGDLMMELLKEIGFVDVAMVDYAVGTDRSIIKDLEERECESIYIEARKAGTT